MKTKFNGGANEGKKISRKMRRKMYKKMKEKMKKHGKDMRDNKFACTTLINAEEGTIDLTDTDNDVLHRTEPADGNIHYTYTLEHGKSVVGIKDAKSIELDMEDTLPLTKVRTCLLKYISSNPVVIIVGDTGSGKTTQVPKMIYESLPLPDGTGIAITQPRRVATFTVAKRVASEMCNKIGELVGYSMRFENCTSKNTKIKYMTDGMLLQEILQDEILSSYRYVILDEAHERTLNSDILFGLVKTAQEKRSHNTPLNIIVMSATMDADKISDYFDKAPVLFVEGRNYNIDIFHTVAEQDDYIFSALNITLRLHSSTPIDHGILIFLTGQEEIEAMVNDLRKYIKALNYPKAFVHPLYASLDPGIQRYAFRNPVEGIRKIVVSTNVAETSVTIKGIKYIVDSGKVKQRRYVAGAGLDTLKVCNVSKAQAWQRAGRAGRESSGYCYRLYSCNFYQNFDEFTLPEILRCNLASTTLNLLKLGINPMTFDFVDKPPKTDFEDAIQQLVQLEAVTEEENETFSVTDVGKCMAVFPLDPKLAKIVMSAASMGCLDEILLIVSFLSQDTTLFYSCPEDETLTTLRKRFYSPYGDLITLLNVFRDYIALPDTQKKSELCKKYKINHRALEYSFKIKKQLEDLCRQHKMKMSSCNRDTDIVRKCLLTGLFTNVAFLTKDKTYMTVSLKHKARIHPTSVLHGVLSPCVLFVELMESNTVYMKNITTVDVDWVRTVVPAAAKNVHALLSTYEKRNNANGND